MQCIVTSNFQSDCTSCESNNFSGVKKKKQYVESHIKIACVFVSLFGLLFVLRLVLFDFFLCIAAVIVQREHPLTRKS